MIQCLLRLFFSHESDNLIYDDRLAQSLSPPLFQLYCIVVEKWRYVISSISKLIKYINFLSLQIIPGQLQYCSRLQLDDSQGVLDVTFCGMEQYDNLELICSSLSSLIFLLFSNIQSEAQSKLTSKKSKYSILGRWW